MIASHAACAAAEVRLPADQLLMVLPVLPDSGLTVSVPAGWCLRAATDDDADALSVLLSEAFDDVWDSRRVSTELLDAPDVTRTWVLTDPTGTVSATASERLMPQTYPGAGYVHYVAVADHARGSGFGSTLTAHCLNGFREDGLTSAVLETHTHRRAAIITYLRLGFVPGYRDDRHPMLWSAVFRELLGPRGRTTTGERP